MLFVEGKLFESKLIEMSWHKKCLQNDWLTTEYKANIPKKTDVKKEGKGRTDERGLSEVGGGRGPSSF